MILLRAQIEHLQVVIKVAVWPQSNLITSWINPQGFALAREESSLCNSAFLLYSPSVCVKFQAYTLLPGHVVSLVAHASLRCDISKTVCLSVAPSAGFKLPSASLGVSIDRSLRESAS